MTQEEQEEVKLLKELIADKSISADEREIYEDALNQLMKSEKPKATTSESKPTTTQRKTRTTPTKKVAPAKGKKSVDDIEKAKAEIKAKTGKTEAECESIIEQYRALRTKAQEGKRKAEQASADNKERVGKLERKGDIIEGTNEKTADAVIESSAKDVGEKIEKEVEAVEAKAEKEAKAEVAKDKTIKTSKDKKEAVEAIVDEEVKKKTQTIVKRVVIDTSALLTSIATSLGKFDKDSQKEFLIKLRSDIDKLISKYAFGGLTDGGVQVMNVQQSNMSSSSVNPSQFGEGGGIDDVIVYDNGGESFDRYTIFTPDGSVYGMSENASGFNQYLGDNTEIEKGSHLGKKLKSVPESIKIAVERRMSEEYARGGGVGELKVGKEDFSFLLKLSDNDLSKRLDLIRKQQVINGKQYLDAKKRGDNTSKIEESGKNLSNQENAIIQARIINNKMARGGGVGEYNQSWHQDHYRHNKGESYEVPVGSRKHKYSVGGTLLSGMVGAYVGYQYGKKGKKAFKFEDGGGVDGYNNPKNATHVLIIDGQNWYLEKIDSTHFYMSNSPNYRGMAHHVGQHKGEPYYEEIRQWLHDTKFESGGVVGQEIVFDDNGDENTGVIKEIHENTGDYIVNTDDGRTILVQLDRDVISLGGMRKQAPMMEAPRKRFGFFEEGGEVDEDEYAKGGLTEHGLREGDKIRNDFSVVYPDDKKYKNVIDVVDRNGDKHFVDLDKGKRYEGGGKILDEYQEEQFQEWLEDGNVIEREKGVYSTQDAQYRNRIIGMDGLRKYVLKEFYSE
jgi:hypothetical protein